MEIMRRMCLAMAAAILLAAAPVGEARATPTVSMLESVPNDPRAVLVRGVGDGHADDSDALQRAIDTAGGPSGDGIVFLPSGRYRLTRSILVPPGIRIFGVGHTRPVLLLGDHTPGFQDGVSTLVVFTGGDQYQVGAVPVPVPTIVPRNRVVRDANSSTFYSSMSNIDFDLGEGNPAAAAVRFRLAQHGFLTHMDFHIRSGFAGVYQAGNEMEDVHFHGGRYGIVTEKTSPAWQFTLIDSSFDGEADAAVREHEADLTLVNVAIRNTPVGIDIDEGYSDSLWGKNVRFENVSRAGAIISAEKSAFTQIGFDNALAHNTPVFARLRDSGKAVTGAGPFYRIAAFNYGLVVAGLGRSGAMGMKVQMRPLAAMPPLAAPAIRRLPPVSEWTNVRELGVTGDGQTDDSAALQHAIDTHRTLYFPVGFYMVRSTLKLRPDTVLIGLHPALTQLVIPDHDPGHAGVGSVVPIIDTPRGGHNIVTGLGLFTGRVNPRAGAVVWRSGEDSLMDDVKIMGGGGTPTADGKPLSVLNGHSGDPVADNRWDAQYPSVWVMDGGGGTFADNWMPDTFAQAGFYVTDTSTPGHVYELSNEHHVRNEIVLDHVKNWEFLAPQTEQEVAEGIDEVSLEIRNSENLLFANYHPYRVTRQFHPATTAVRLFNSGNIRFRNFHTNAESGFASCQADGCGTYLRSSKFPFEDSIEDKTHHLIVREREFAMLDVPGVPPPVAPAMIAGFGPIEKLEEGFWSISGAAVDPGGTLYFVEHRMQRIYRWTHAKGLEIVRDNPLDPVNLGVDRSGHLLVLSSLGANATVYSIDPDGPKDQLTIIAPTPVRSHPNASTLLPANWWDNGEFRDQFDPSTNHFTTLSEMFARDVGMPKQREYVSPDGSLVLPAFRVWQQGSPDHVGWRFSDSLDALGFVAAKIGQRVLVSNESEDRTYSALAGEGGALTDLRVFADRGGESVATDDEGRVYVANGQVFVYDAAGRPLGQIDVPERPIQLIVGGAGRRTLFMLAHHALFAISIPPDRVSR
jgi:hypothetical protein